MVDVVFTRQVRMHDYSYLIRGGCPPLVKKRNDDFSSHIEPSQPTLRSGSIRARQCAQNAPCRTTYPGANLRPHLCIAHAHAHFFCHLHKIDDCAVMTKTGST